MNKAQKLRFYIEALCVYDLKKDEVVSGLLRLLQSVGSEDVLERQSEFFRMVTSHNSFKEYLSRLILTDDNAFTKAAAADRADRLPAAVLNGVKSDLKKLEAIANVAPRDIYESVENTDLRQVLKTLPGWQTGEPAAPLKTNWEEQIGDLTVHMLELVRIEEHPVRGVFHIRLTERIGRIGREHAELTDSGFIEPADRLQLPAKRPIGKKRFERHHGANLLSGQKNISRFRRQIHFIIPDPAGD